MLGRSGSAGSSGKDGLAVFSRRDATGRQRRLSASAPRFLMLSYRVPLRLATVEFPWERADGTDVG